MTDRAKMEQTLRAAYAARQRGDIDGIVQHFGPEPVFHMAGAAHASPVAMRIEGAAPFRAAMQQMITVFAMEDYDIRTILIDGDRAAVQWHATFRSTVTNDRLETDLFDLVTFKDGRIVSFMQFCDTAAAARLMGH
jgi:ketosteroid isomerase-like protein